MYTRFFSLAVALAFLAFPVAQAQVIFDDFDDGDFTNTFQFSEFGGAGVGIGPTTGPDDSAALRADIDPSATGGFAGFGFTKPGGGIINVAGQKYFTFFLRTSAGASNTPLVLELNLQEDVGNNGYDPLIDDEFQAKLDIEAIPADCWKLIQIPVAAFTDDNSVNPGADNGFDFSKLFQVIIAIGGPTGPAYSLDLDEVTFAPNAPALTQEVVLNNFEADPTASVFTFSETNMGIGVGSADPAPAATGSTQALSVGINPAETGAFAGFVITKPGGGTITTSSADYIGFYLRPNVNATNTPLVLEINLHEDANGNGTYEGASEDEFQANYLVETGDAGVWQFVAIPLSVFTDDNSVFAGADDGFAFNKLLEVVVAIGGLSGDEYTIEVDDVFFGGVQPSGPIVINASPEAQSVARGDAASFSYQVTNNTGSTQSGVAFYEVFLANDTRVVGPVQIRSGSIAANSTTPSLNFSVNVPNSAPTTTYTVAISAGPTNGNATSTDEVLVTVTLSEGLGGNTGTWDLASADPWPTLEAAARTAAIAAFPNPFADATTIQFETIESSDVRLAVYDVTGREVAVLVDGTLGAGTHEATFDARGLASGLYVYRLEADAHVETGRITLVR